jgi:cell division protein FtsB
MATKAQEAALRFLRQREKSLMEKARHFSLEKILREINALKDFISEYHLERQLLTEIVRGVYGLLMDGERYAEAAAIAKTYRL